MDKTRQPHVIRTWTMPRNRVVQPAHPPAKAGKASFRGPQPKRAKPLPPKQTT